MAEEIREASWNDIELINELVRKSFKDVADRFRLDKEKAPTHPSHSQPDWIETAMDRGVVFYILEDDGQALGCVALERANSKVCYLERLAVLPEYRRAGRGRSLVEFAMNRAEDQGAGRIEIAIIAEQKDLKDWYQRMGFSMKGTKKFAHLPFTVAFMFINL